MSEENVEQFPNAMRDAVEKLRPNMGGLLEYQRMIAQLQREKYNALLEQGFSEEHALRLCERVMP